MRIYQAGWQIYCVPEAKIVHHMAQSTQQFRNPMFIALWRSRYLLFEKQYSPSFRRAARAIVHLGLVWQMKQLSLTRQSEEEVQARRQAYQAVWAMS